MSARVIFEDDEVRVVHRPGATDYTLLTFAALAHRPKGTWIWADRPVEKLDIEAIGVVGKRENWYPAASMLAAAPTIRALLRPVAIGYGYSMGGYAVLKYGRLLGLTHGIAVSPQTTIDPVQVPSDRRFHRFHNPLLHGGMAVLAGDAPPVTFAVGDTMWDLDGSHLRRAAALPGVSLVPLRFMKHAAIDRFASTRELAALISLVLAGDAAALRAHLRRGRQHSAEQHLWVGRSAASRGHLKMATRLWARAEALGAKPAKIVGVRGLALRERQINLFVAHRIPEARAFADIAIDGQGDSATGLVRLGQFLQGRRMPGKAMTCFRRALAASPRMVQAHVGLLEVLRDVAPPGPTITTARAAAIEALGDRPADLATVLALDISYGG